MGNKQKKQKIVLPPELPPDVPDEDIEVSDEDLQFVTDNQAYAGFVSNLDTQTITKHVSRVADAKEDAVEAMYEKRLRKKSIDKEKDKNVIEVDPVDALPVKTLDGKLYYRTIPKAPPRAQGEAPAANEDDDADKSVVKFTKAEKRLKLKKTRKEAKQQAKDDTRAEEEQIAQDEALAEANRDVTAEEAREKKRFRLAELGTALLEDPETNIKALKEMLEISKDVDYDIVIIGLKSLLAVFKDIIPGYRIRLPTEKEQEMKISKVIKKMRYYEATLLTSYKAYMQKLISLEEQPVYTRIAVRCLCTLLEAVPHFNFNHNLLAAVVKNISSEDEVVRKNCCATVKYLFTNEGKHGGDLTLEAVQLIASIVKDHNCHLHPDSIEVLLSLSFDDDLAKPEKSDADNKFLKGSRKRKREEEKNKNKNKLPDNDRKKSKKEMMSKTREEVEADFKSVSFVKDAAEQRKQQSDTLSAVFQIYFRVLKHTLQPRAESNSTHLESHPLLAPCLNGIGKFSHLLDMDFMADLMNYLRKLAAGAGAINNSNGADNISKRLTVSERLQCCIVSFKVMKNNLDALNVDLQEFFVQLYNLILEYRPGRDPGDVLAEALKIMLCDERQHDMQRAAAFIKRLTTFALCFGSAESMAALVTVKHLLQKNVKCRNLLENDVGGGSVSGAISKYQPYATDPHLSGALASVLWELNLLSKHYHSSVSTMASSISTMTSANNQVYHVILSPQQAFAEMSHDKELFNSATDMKQSISKRKKGTGSSKTTELGLNLDATMGKIDENALRKKLSEHFLVLRDISENEKLRSELDRTTLSLNLYEQYKKQKKKTRRS